MAKDIQRVADLFDGKKQYRTPLYQRRYVWQKMHWKVLWDDIVRIKRQLETGKDYKEHFTGTIVTQSDENESALDKYEIIDGQQRLTTFQIIFCVIRDISASSEYTNTGLKSKINGIIELPEYDIKREKERIKRIAEASNCDEEDDFFAYSLVLKGSDQEVFESLVMGTEKDPNSAITQAYKYYYENINAYLENEEVSNLQNLMDALAYNFHVVQVKIEPNDDPQQIFGSINGTGRILDEFDLLRNDLFLRVKDGKKKDNLYRKYWKGFDEKDFWEEPGRADSFLWNFLTAKLGPIPFSSRRLFHDIYKGQYYANLQTGNEQDVKMEFVEIAKYAESYQALEETTTNIGRRMQFYGDLKITSLRPFILYLKNELNIADSELEQVCNVLESYLMRRMVNYGYGANDKDKEAYERIDEFFSRLIAGEKFTVGKFAKYLCSRDWNAPTSWPTNIQILGGHPRRQKSGVTAGGLQRTADEIHFGKHSSHSAAVSLLRYIFYRIERHTTEDTLSYNNFLDISTRINVLADEDRNWRSIGNLTFRAEDELSEEIVNYYNFNEIKEVLSVPPNSDFKLNREICEYENWDADRISERTKKLGSYFCEIWPDADSFMIEILTQSINSNPEKLYDGVVKSWNARNSMGYIELSGLGKNVQVSSDDLDPSVPFGILHEYLKVKFNLKIVQRDEAAHFHACNVILVTTGEFEEGTVKKFEQRSGYGYLTLSEYPNGIYVHRTQVRSADINLLQEGQNIEFILAETIEDKLPIAINVKLVRAWH